MRTITDGKAVVLERRMQTKRNNYGPCGHIFVCYKLNTNKDCPLGYRIVLSDACYNTNDGDYDDYDDHVNYVSGDHQDDDDANNENGVGDGCDDDDESGNHKSRFHNIQIFC